MNVRIRIACLAFTAAILLVALYTRTIELEIPSISNFEPDSKSAQLWQGEAIMTKMENATLKYLELTQGPTRQKQLVPLTQHGCQVPHLSYKGREDGVYTVH
jgi:hypothetical protein